MTFDIYEGQITALLGHSGAGKSTLMSILCGICPPTTGSASMFGSPITEMADGAEMKQLVGVCPQFNIVFDVLTVEEHLGVFAAIKGIPPADVDSEVSRCRLSFQSLALWSCICTHAVSRNYCCCLVLSSIVFDQQVSKVLKDLELDKIRSAQVKNLSAGQKRKLSVGIAILGDPKVWRRSLVSVLGGPSGVRC